MFSQDELKGQEQPDKGDIQGTVETQVDALTKDATIEYYHEINPGATDEEGDPIIPNAILDEQGEFPQDPGSWDTDEPNGLRDEAMDAIEAKELPSEVEEDDIKGHLHKFQEPLNQSIKISPYST